MYFCISTFSSTLIYVCRTSCVIFLVFSLLRDVTPIPALKWSGSSCNYKRSNQYSN